MLNPNNIQTSHFAPPGMIPEFNELGNHPHNMGDYIKDKLEGTLGRLGVGERHAEIEGLLFRGIEDLSAVPPGFTGRHSPTAATMSIQRDVMEGTFIRKELCTVSGEKNYEAALDMVDRGQNVVLIPNHTSPLDGLLPLTLFSDKYPKAERPSLVMSQVFEYARITRLLTSGVHKYPVFQPKHMERFESQAHVMHQMYGQNATTMRALYTDTRQGGQNVFLYLERDRNTNGMGIPEPAAVRVLEMMEKAKPDVHILPMHIDGAQTVFPSRKGVNEIDVFLDNIQIGQGDVVCGEPISFADVLKTADSINQHEVVGSIMTGNERVLEDPKQRRLAAAAIIILGLVADLAPTEEAKGVYRNMDPIMVR